MQIPLKVSITLLMLGAGLTSTSVTLSDTLDELQKRGEIRIAIANEIPYGFTDLSGKPQGAGPDVAKEIIKRLGIEKIQWITTSFGSLIPGLQAKRYDMVAAEMAILPQRCKQVRFSEPNSSYGEGLLVAKGNPDNVHTYEHFARHDNKVAVMAGADQLDILQDLGIPSSRMVTISNNSDAISTVATGRATAYAATSLTVSELAGKSNKVEAAAQFEDPVINGAAVRSWGAFTFNKEADSLADAFDKELEQFKKTPEWRDTLMRYGFSEHDLEESFNQTRAELCAGQ